jgi:predicted enzyme related to lactoylglutathione lyase
MKAQRPSSSISMLITFLYYSDLAEAIAFYEEVLGLELAIDQGWCKIYGVSPGGYVGLVDESKGYHRVSEDKPVMVCMRVDDVDAWYRYLVHAGVEALGEPKESSELGIRAFLFMDPGGYVLEIQSTLEGS